MNAAAFKNIYTQLKEQYYSILKYDYDVPKILQFCAQYSQIEKNNCKILDVGCGYGKKLKALQEAGYDALGVEVNTKVVEININNGLNCLTLEEFRESASESFDIILMSHIIEHFTPNELKDVMDSYLDRLKVGGYLIIATPLISSYFYNDFDHIKPYNPRGIIMVFGEDDNSQVQYYSRNKLQIKDLWFRRRHYIPRYFKGKYIKTKGTKFLQIGEFLSALLCLSSFRLIGQTDGWIGVFKKVKVTK